jgi:hypothetical protein
MKDELRRPMFFIVSARKNAGGTKASSPKPCAEHAAS